MSSSTILNEGLVQNPASSTTGDGQTGDIALGKQNEQLVAEAHGQWYNAAMRGCLFTFNVTAITVKLVASGLVSTFSLYNPLGSNKVLELVDFDFGLLTGTAVIDVLGLYWQGAPGSSGSTFTTAGVFGTNFFGGSPGRGQPVGVPYSALTHVGLSTTARVAILNSWNAAANVIGTPIHYDFNGKVVLYPGDLVSLAASTTILTAITSDAAIRWAEWPYPV